MIVRELWVQFYIFCDKNAGLGVEGWGGGRKCRAERGQSGARPVWPGRSRATPACLV